MSLQKRAAEVVEHRAGDADQADEDEGDERRILKRPTRQRDGEREADDQPHQRCGEQDGCAGRDYPGRGLLVPCLAVTGQELCHARPEPEKQDHGEGVDQVGDL